MRGHIPIVLLTVVLLGPTALPVTAQEVQGRQFQPDLVTVVDYASEGAPTAWDLDVSGLIALAGRDPILAEVDAEGSDITLVITADDDVRTLSPWAGGSGRTVHVLHLYNDEKWVIRLDHHEDDAAGGQYSVFLEFSLAGTGPDEPFTLDGWGEVVLYDDTAEEHYQVYFDFAGTTIFA